MMLNYKAIEIFTDEEARCQGKPVTDAVLDYVHSLKIAARCIVTRGIAGCYESGEITTTRVEVLSYNLPVRIYIVLPAAAIDQVLAGLDPLVSDGIIALHDLSVVSHKAANSFFPRQLLVRDVMTPTPVCITGDRPLDEAARLLLSSIFTGLPVVDGQGCPVGVITQGDLITKGGLPLRLGLLADSGEKEKKAVLDALAGKRVQDIMTPHPVTASEDTPLSMAVDLMLHKQLKRLPVVDKKGKLSGMLSRLDIFRTVMREAPDWDAFRAQKVEVRNLHRVGDILRRDTLTVSPETTIDQVLPMIDGNDIQCVAVVDGTGKLLGMLTDSDLLRFFQPDPVGLRALVDRFTHPGTKDFATRLTTTTAAEVMRTDGPTTTGDTPLAEAISLMTAQKLKRLPVVDKEGCFQGMISRDSLLRTGYASHQLRRS